MSQITQLIHNVLTFNFFPLHEVRYFVYHASYFGRVLNQADLVQLFKPRPRNVARWRSFRPDTTLDLRNL